MGYRLLGRGSCPLGVTRVIRPSSTGTNRSSSSSASSSRWCGREARLICFSISLLGRVTACYAGCRSKCATCRYRWWRHRRLSAGARRDPSRRIRHRDWPPPASPGRLVVVVAAAAAAASAAATRRSACGPAGTRPRWWRQSSRQPNRPMRRPRICRWIRWAAVLVTNASANPPATRRRIVRIARSPRHPVLAFSTSWPFRWPYNRIWEVRTAPITPRLRHPAWAVDGDAIVRIRRMRQPVTELASIQRVRWAPPMPLPRPLWPVHPHRWHWTKVWRWT